MHQLFVVEAWATYLDEKKPPQRDKGFVGDVHDTCESEMTFVIDNGNVEVQGHQNLHARQEMQNYLAPRAEFATFARYDGEEDGAMHCDYTTLIVYPSKRFEFTFHTNQPYLRCGGCLCRDMFRVCNMRLFIHGWFIDDKTRL